jgi:hypothetical protein
VGRAGAGYRGADRGATRQHPGSEDGRVAAHPAALTATIPVAITWAFAHFTLLSLGLIMAPSPAHKASSAIAHNRLKGSGTA